MLSEILKQFKTIIFIELYSSFIVYNHMQEDNAYRESLSWKIDHIVQ